MYKYKNSKLQKNNNKHFEDIINARLDSQQIDDKKKKELTFLKQFLSYSKKNIEDIIIDKEKPDFRVIMNSKKIGIEITEMINEELKKQEGYWENICQLLNEKIADDIDLKTSQISINIMPYKKYKIGNKENVVNEIYQHIKNEIRKPNYIQKVDIIKLNKGICYINFGVYYINELDKKCLIKRIQEKDEKIKNYEKMDKQWLLLVIGQAWQSSSDELNNKINYSEIEAVKNSPFDEIFILEVFNQHVHKIK